MSIDINGISNKPIPARVGGTGDEAKVRQQQTAQTAETGQSSTNDTFSLSDSARQLGKLDNASSAAPVIDTQRVEQVKQAIKDGSYSVDPVKIANKLMQFESMLKPKG